MHSRLSYGVMVAQQFLVLFVVVRIRLGQHNEGFLFIEKAFVVLRRKGKIVVVRIRLGQHNDGFLFIEEAFVVLCRKGENCGTSLMGSVEKYWGCFFCFIVFCIFAL